MPLALERIILDLFKMDSSSFQTGRSAAMIARFDDRYEFAPFHIEILRDTCRSPFILARAELHAVCFNFLPSSKRFCHWIGRPSRRYRVVPGAVTLGVGEQRPDTLGLDHVDEHEIVGGKPDWHCRSKLPSIHDRKR